MYISTYFYQYSVFCEKLTWLHFFLIDTVNFKLHNVQFFSLSGCPVFFHFQRHCFDLMVQLRTGDGPVNSSQASKQCPLVKIFSIFMTPLLYLQCIKFLRGIYVLINPWNYEIWPFHSWCNQKGISPYNVYWISSSGNQKKEKHHLMNPDWLRTRSDYTKL